MITASYTADEIMEEWRLYRQLVPVGCADIPPEAKRQWDFLVEFYIPVAHKIAAKRNKALPAHIELVDVQSWAVLGMIEAVNSYDPDRGAAFETFATRRISGKITDHLRQLDWAPRALRKQQKQVAEAENALFTHLSRTPTPHEIANYLSVSSEEVASIRARALAASPSYLEEAGLYAEIQEFSSEEQDLLREVREVIVETITAMPLVEQAVLVLHYYREIHFKHIAPLLGINDSKVSDYHTSALNKIWDALRARELV